MTREIVGSESKKVKTLAFKQYCIGLLLSQKRKNCIGIADVLGISHDKVYSLFQGNLKELLIELPRRLLRAAQGLIRNKCGWLIVDDSTVNKMFGELFEGTSKHYNSSTGTLINGYSIVTIAWTDGKTIIPLLFAFYFKQEICQEQSKTKIQLAKKLISESVEVIDCEGVLMDGLYCSYEMIAFLKHNDIYFEMRMHSNRKVKTRFGGEKSLKTHPDLKLNRNQKRKSIEAEWKGLNIFLTAEKRTVKHGETLVVFIVSNRNVSAKCHVETYALRWGIEMLFRTLKQSIGLQQCQSRSIERQSIHIYASLFAYILLQHYRDRHKLSNVESAIKHMWLVKSSKLINQLVSTDQIFGSFA